MAELKTTVKKTTSAKKTTTKTAVKKTPVKKVATKKAEVKTTPVVEKCECNCGCNCEKKLNYIIYLTAAILALVVILLGIVISNNNSTSSSPENNESEESSYDVSMFEELTTTDAIAKINKDKKVLVYIGRANCGYCVKFLPNLQKAQKEFGYKTVYVDLTKVSGADQEEWAKFGGAAKGYDETCVEPENATITTKCGKLGLTPQVLIFENGKLKGDWVGYSEYNEFVSFLAENGYKK